MKEFKNYEEVKFNLDPLEYDADAVQIVPLEISQRTSKGVSFLRLTHKIEKVTDERYLSREKQLFDNAKRGKESFEPTTALWRDVCSDATGYPKDWKTKMPYEHQANALLALFDFRTIDETAEKSEEVFSFDELSCIRLCVLYGAVDLKTWTEWLTKGAFPSNLELTRDQFEKVSALVKKGIAPNAEIEVRHFFRRASQPQITEFIRLQNNMPRQGVLASAARANEETEAERLKLLADQLEAKTENYKSRVPVWWRIAAVKLNLLYQLSELGKFSNA